MQLLMLLEKFDNLDETNDPLPSPQAFLNATLSETDPGTLGLQPRAALA